jgi:hypothetical protein
MLIPTICLNDTRYNASANSSNKTKILEEEVPIYDCEQSLQSISPILSSEGTDTQCIKQIVHLMSEQNQLSQDWVDGLEGETVIFEDVTIRLSTSISILEGNLNVTCVQCESGKSISPIDSAQPTMAHNADTDSDLARPPDGKHPSAREQAQPAEGRSRRTGGGSGPTTSIRNAGGAFTNRMTAETLRMRADLACVIYICKWAVTTTRKWY